MPHEFAGTRKPYRIGGSIGLCTCGFESPWYRKRAKAIRAVDRHITKETAPPPPKCPHRTKTKFDTEAAALDALNRSWRKPGAGPRPSRTYLCQCQQHWHLTKEEIRR